MMTTAQDRECSSAENHAVHNDAPRHCDKKTWCMANSSSAISLRVVGTDMLRVRTDIDWPDASIGLVLIRRRPSGHDTIAHWKDRVQSPDPCQNRH